MFETKKVKAAFFTSIVVALSVLLVETYAANLSVVMKTTIFFLSSLLGALISAGLFKNN